MNGSLPKYARFPAEMATAAYFGIWLALSDHVGMPEIGWGHQFGLTHCGETAFRGNLPIEVCKAWEARQSLYRQPLSRLFVRHWQLTPSVSVETYASDAFRQVLQFASNRDRGDLANLEPRGEPRIAVGGRVESNGIEKNDFEIFLRWSDFPPANDLRLSHIYLALDFVDADGSRSSISPDRKDGDPETFRRLDLEVPKVSKITLCGYDLKVRNVNDSQFEEWYFPSPEGTVVNAFALENYTAGYQYDPEGLSPLPLWRHYFSRPINRTSFVCGPALRYTVGSHSHDLNREVDSMGAKYYFEELIDEKYLESRRLPDGTFLLKSGPKVEPLNALGHGQCGSCPTARLAIFRLDPTRGITEALRQELVQNAPYLCDAEIRITPDWRTVTVYRNENCPLDDQPEAQLWTMERFCWSEGTYTQCATGPSKPPPSPRAIDWKAQ